MILTQTNWLKMPARELGSSFDAPNGARSVGTTLLKRHKTLPHPREPHVPEQPFPPNPPSRPRDLVIDTQTPSVPSSDGSSPRTLKHASKRIGAPGLPPTPPTHSRQSSGNQAPITSAPPPFDVSSIRPPTSAPSTPGTPTNQRSPPTPDVTPPRVQRATTALRTPLSSRFPPSRTDSFKTARENLDSSDDDNVSTVRPILPSARQSVDEVAQLPHIKQRKKEVGLGLGLESDNEGTATPKQGRGASQQDFGVFDGEWGASGGEASEVEREWDDNLMRNVTVRKRPARKLHLSTNIPKDEVVEDDFVSPTSATRAVRSLPLQERIAKHRLERDLANRRSTEHFAERIAWPAAVADPESPSTPDVRRFSTMSGRSITSAVVEAMVVDAPPPMRRKTLRHTKKQIGLRDFSSGQSSVTSGPNSTVSTDPLQHLHHSRGRIPEKRHRSLTSNSTVRTNSSSGKSRREILSNGGIPVLVIPERRSSSKSSQAHSLRSTSSRKSKRSNSLGSAPLSHSSKFNEPGYFEIIPARKRTMSESAGSNHSVRTMDYPPAVPVRRSSLSAPTSRNGSRAPSLAPESRNTSRAGSLTAESLKAHNMLPANRPQPDPQLARSQPTQSQPSESHKDLSHRHTALTVDHNGDPFFGNRLSTQVTPFSQYSYETAGTNAEVSEAMMVSIYPHQNKSVLVVQHQPPDSTPPTLKPLDTSNNPAPTMAINGAATDGPVTPPQPKHPMDEVDSPLRNPRAPPQPPAIKFIPPTPAGLTPGQEEERQLGYDPNERPVTADRPKRGLSLMRRTFKNRRNSEPAATPGLGFLKRAFSLSNTPRREQSDESTQTSKGEANPSTLYPSVTDQPPDGSKLHPFWRPARFWDDLEGHDYESDEEEFGGRFPIIDNRPPPPRRSLSGKLKRTFAILPIKNDPEYAPYATERRTVRRTPSGNMRVVKQRSNSSLRRDRPATSNRRFYTDDNDDYDENNGNRRPHSERLPSKDQPLPFGHDFKEGNGGHRAYSIPGLGVRVEYVGWGGLKRKLSERRREQRSQRLRDTISGPRAVQSGVDDVLRRRGGSD